MKKILKYTVAVLAVTGLVANAELINLTNPSLETGLQLDTTTALAGWFSYGNALAAVPVGPGEFWGEMANADGPNAAYITSADETVVGVGGGEDAGGNLYQNVELDAGVTYRLTAGIGTHPSVWKNDAKFQLLFFQAGVGILNNNTGVIGAHTGAFADYSVDYTPGTAGSYRVGIRNMGYVPGTGEDNSQSTILVDNVRLEVVPEPATLGLVAVFGGAVLFIRRRLMI